MSTKDSAERACKEPNPIIDGRKANVNLAILGAKPRGNLTGRFSILGAKPIRGNLIGRFSILGAKPRGNLTGRFSILFVILGAKL